MHARTNKNIILPWQKTTTKQTHTVKAVSRKKYKTYLNKYICCFLSYVSECFQYGIFVCRLCMYVRMHVRMYACIHALFIYLFIDIFI